jgi:hypothetical protein
MQTHVIPSTPGATATQVTTAVPRSKPQLRVLPPSYVNWLNAIMNGDLCTIVRGMTLYNINAPHSIYQNVIPPIISLFIHNHHEVVAKLLANPVVDVNVLDYGFSLMDFIVNNNTCQSAHVGHIIKLLLDNPYFEVNVHRLFSGLFTNNTINDEYCDLIKHHRIDINDTYFAWSPNGTMGANITGTIGTLLSHKLGRDTSEKCMHMVRTLFSRSDLNINKIVSPHPMMLPYIKFDTLKRTIINHRYMRSRLLPKPSMWTGWQSIAYQLQTPPLSESHQIQLKEYAKVIHMDPHESPINICVQLAQHYEIYNNTLTYKHKIDVRNDDDLYGNPFSEMPVEHIIVDDDKYAFCISEIPQLLQFKRHPYTGKEWKDVTVGHIPFIDYFKQNPINPFHLLHQLVHVDEGMCNSSDEQNIRHLMEWLPSLSPVVGQVYINSQRCRDELLGKVGINYIGHPSFAEFCDKIIEFIRSFPTQELTMLVQQSIYRQFESCQIYA